MIARTLRTSARSGLGAMASALVLLAAIAPTTLGAQERWSGAAPSCLDTIPSSAFTRVPVYLEAKAADSTIQAALPAMDSLAIRAGAMVRSSLGESATTLPEGELLLRWRQVGGSVRVAVHHDGLFTWSTPPRDSADTVQASSRLLLTQSLAALRNAGTKIGLPADVAADSLTFDLAYRWPDAAPDGTLKPLLLRPAAVPVFTMAMPRSKELALRRPPHLVYPPASHDASIEGVVILQFVVDTTGRVVMNSIRDKWPADRPRLAGTSAAHYQAFIDAAKRGLSGARFEPATLGGCRVPQLAEEPFTFNLSR